MVVAVALAVAATANALVPARSALQIIYPKNRQLWVTNTLNDVTRWNSHSYVLVQRPAIEPSFMWGPGRGAEQFHSRIAWLAIDGEAGTPITEWNGELAGLDWVSYDVTAVPYSIRRAGDVAIMDPDGYFRIVDRLKEMIIVSGFNVYPNEVEDALYHHPKVSKVAVIGVPDDTTGEGVKAFVVLKEGETATAEEIVAWARDPKNGLTAYRAPKQVEFRDALPETMVGKVLRRVLAEEERSRAGAGTPPAP